MSVAGNDRYVLVVDEDSDSARTLSALLEDDGIPVVHKTDPDEGIGEARRRAPWLMVVSADMPDGLPTCDRVKRDRKLHSIPVMLVAEDAADGAQIAHWFQPTRADLYVRKPVSSDFVGAFLDERRQAWEEDREPTTAEKNAAVPGADADADADRDELLARLAMMRELLARAAKAEDTLQGAANAAEQELDFQRELADQATDEIEQSMERAEELEAQLDEVRAELTAARAEAEQARASVRELEEGAGRASMGGGGPQPGRVRGPQGPRPRGRGTGGARHPRVAGRQEGAGDGPARAGDRTAERGRRHRPAA